MPQRIVAPVAGRDHPTIQVEDPHQLQAVESGDWAPVPGLRERRDDAQALFTFGWGWRASLERPSSLRSSSISSLELAEPSADRIDILAARRSVRHEAGAVVDRVDRDRPCRDADDGLRRRRHPW